MEYAEAAAVIARVVQICGLVSALGIFAFRLLIVPGESRPDLAPLVVLARASLLAALVGTAARLLAEAAVIGGAERLREALAAMPDIVRYSRFGALLLAEGVLLALALPAWRGRLGAATGAFLLTLAAILDAGSLHGAAVPGLRGRVLWGVASLHVLSAGVWLGGIAPLALLLRRVPAAVATTFVARFSRLAAIAVAVLAVSALAQGAALIGSGAMLTQSPYGRLILLKSALFLVLLGFAARNRLLLLPALRGANGELALRMLRHNLRRALVLAFLVLLAAGLLASLAPGSAPPLPAGGSEGGEQAATRRVFPGAPFGMPLHTDREVFRIPHAYPLDGAVGGRRLDDEGGGRPVDRLLMDGIHHDLAFADDRRKLAREADGMARGITRLAIALMAEMGEAAG